MVITGEVTEKNVDQIKLDQKVNINLIDATSLTGSISYVSKSANPSTRTYKIQEKFNNKDGSIREGISADIDRNVVERLHHYRFLIKHYLKDGTRILPTIPTIQHVLDAYDQFNLPVAISVNSYTVYVEEEPS